MPNRLVLTGVQQDLPWRRPGELEQSARQGHGELPGAARFRHGML